MKLINSDTEGASDMGLKPGTVYEKSEDASGVISLRPVRFGPLPKLEAGRPNGVYVSRDSGTPLTSIVIRGNLGNPRAIAGLAGDMAEEFDLPVIADPAGLGIGLIDQLRDLHPNVTVIAYNAAAAKEKVA